MRTRSVLPYAIVDIEPDHLLKEEVAHSRKVGTPYTQLTIEGGVSVSYQWLLSNTPQHLKGDLKMLTIKQLNTKITSVSKRSATLRMDIQSILVHAAGHAFQSRDVTSFSKLFNATSGMNRKLIAAWVAKYGFATLQKDGTYKLNKKAHKEADFADGAEVVTYLLENASDWWVAEEGGEAIVKALDVAKRVEAISDSIDKAANDNRDVTVDADAIRAAIAKLSDKLNDHIGKATADSRFAA